LLEELWQDAPDEARAFVGALQETHTYPIRDAVEYALTLAGQLDKFFTPAVLRDGEGRSKASFLASRCLWVDWDTIVDTPDVPHILRRCTLPPNFVASTGGGYHLYWLLQGWVTDLAQVEEANKLLVEDVGGDDCWDGTRILRLPSTLNSKYEPAIEANVVLGEATHRYLLADVLALTQVGKKTRHKIRTGDRRGYRSRSERDLAIVGNLLRAGVSVETVQYIYEKHACGDRYREEGDRGFDYLRLAVSKVLGDEALEQERTANAFTEDVAGLYYSTGKQQRHVATFTFTPERLLEVVEGDDALMGTVQTQYGYTEDVVLPRQAFNSVRALQRELRSVTWQWLGTDKVVREYLPYLVGQLHEQGMPTTVATTTLGYYPQEGGCYVFDGWTLSQAGLATGYERPVIYVEQGREHPRYYGARRLGKVERATVQRQVHELLPQINVPEVVYPALGWFLATPLKVQLRALGYKFPTLDVYGTRGSGKTTLIQDVFMRLLGVCSDGGGTAVSYDANTTRFVTLALLGGSNCVPISFSEFREAAVRALTRYILLAYDSGRDPRGRSDQTTVSHPLTAPFVVDGEDRISDPASVERTVAIGLNPATVVEGSSCAHAYTELAKLPLSELAEDVYSWCLQADVGALLLSAEQHVARVLPNVVPDRIRRNTVVCAVGLQVAEASLGIAPNWDALAAPALDAVAERGRTLVSADSFIEEVVNAAAGMHCIFPHSLAEPGLLRFQFTPAYNWWVTRLRRRGLQGPLAPSSIRRQLAELASEGETYVRAPTVVKERYMWGISLAQAQHAGLDVPDKILKGPRLKVKGGDV
jgi:hypothetical protein